MATPPATPATPAPDPLEQYAQRLTLAAALDRALLEDALRVDAPREEATPDGLARQADTILARMGEDERHRRVERALRLLARTEELAA